MSEYRQRFDELYQFFAGYFHQDWIRVYDWEDEPPTYASVIGHFKVTNPKLTVHKVRNQLEDFLHYNLDESELKQALNELGCNYYPNDTKEKYRSWLEDILMVFDDPNEEGRVLREIE